MQTRQSNKVHAREQKEIVNPSGKLYCELTNKIGKEFLKYHHKNLLSQKFWCVSGGIYLDKNWQNIMPFVKSTTFQSLYLERNEYPEILLQVCHPIYTHLRFINFQGNLIANIEALAFFNMENLLELNLNENFIVTTKALNKAKWPSFSKLSLLGNPIKRLQINRMKMGQIELQFKFQERENECLDEDFASFTAKIESNAGKKSVLKISSSGRIAEIKKLVSISKKFGKIEMKMYEWE